MAPRQTEIRGYPKTPPRTTPLRRIRDPLLKENDSLTLECVVYAHELDAPGFWKPLEPLIDTVSLCIWGCHHLEQIEEHIRRCRAVFPGKPIVVGCYLRDYPTRAPMPMPVLRLQWDILLRALHDRRIDGFDILGTVVIDGHLEQATWIRDLIRANS